jgi:hypothetical protein
MDSIDRSIMEAKSPIEVPEPPIDQLKALAIALENIHGEKCDADHDGGKCPIQEKLFGHVYLTIRMNAGPKLPHIIAVLMARMALEDFHSGKAPREIAKAIEAATELTPASILPLSSLN